MAADHRSFKSAINRARNVPPEPARKKISAPPRYRARSARAARLAPENFCSSRIRSWKRTSIGPPVEILAESEQMALDRDPRSIKRGPRPHVRHRRIQFPAHGGFRRIHAKLRQQFLFRRQIESREENRPPAPGPGANFAGQRKRPPQQRNRPGDIAARHRAANRGARNDLPANFDRRNNLDVKPVALPKLAQQPHIPGAAMSKPEIRADQNRARAQALRPESVR